MIFLAIRFLKANWNWFLGHENCVNFSITEWLSEVLNTQCRSRAVSLPRIGMMLFITKRVWSPPTALCSYWRLSLCHDSVFVTELHFSDHSYISAIMKAISSTKDKVSSLFLFHIFLPHIFMSNVCRNPSLTFFAQCISSPNCSWGTHRD